jgi:hypothetical protein
MSIKMRIRAHKIIITVCGLLFGGAALSDTQEANPFIKRIIKVQNGSSARVPKNSKNLRNSPRDRAPAAWENPPWNNPAWDNPPWNNPPWPNRPEGKRL